jgi:hypothetical protein
MMLLWQENCPENSPEFIVVMSQSESSLRVGLGTLVEVDLIDERGNAERMAFHLVKVEAADISQGLLNEESPLAKAIRGKLAGAVIPYTMGDIRQVRVVSVAPAQMTALSDAETRREAVLKKALSDAERANAQMFAASFSGKWGDYDPDGVDEWEE